MGTETNKDERSTPEYLAQLLKDKKQIQAFPNVFVHLEKLLDEEINRVRLQLFHHKGNGRIPLDLPEPIGPVQTISEKLYVPVKEHPDFNFVGRILGPRGMTAKELEQFTGCKIMVRGKGSMRDKKKEEQNRGKPNWEHLNEELHVLITVEDTVNRAEVKMAKAMEEVKKLLVPAPEGEDDLKKMQLMELAILNGTYRDSKAIPLARKSQACLRERQGNPDGEDDLKKRQLMELAIINGTYRDTSKPPTTQAGGGQSSTSTHAFGLPWNAQLQTMQMLGQFDTSGLDHKSILKTSEAPRFLTAASPLTAGISQLRSPTPAGAPLILAPRMPQVATSSATMINPPPLVSPTDSAATGLMYNPYEYPYSLQPAATLVEYPTSIEQTAAVDNHFKIYVQCLRCEGPWTLYGHTLTQGWLFHKFGGSCAYETNSNPPEHLKNKSELQNTGSGASIKGSNARHLTLSPTMFYSQ
ncbi:protein quaking-B-like isoform X5 [Crassostrea angulata]|uniref:Protein quaking-B n=1 Tax=Magallana gigas TaxID=29159 RepID=K1QD80_MAGGI|nr:protein quaking-B-like isoform X5 [Crassostrea angulata]